MRRGIKRIDRSIIQSINQSINQSIALVSGNVGHDLGGKK
jgi:hypothetical protein